MPNIDVTKPIRLVGTHELVTYARNDGSAIVIRLPKDMDAVQGGRWFNADGTRQKQGASFFRDIEIENVPEGIDVTKPLEAVRKSDGKVVPITFTRMMPDPLGAPEFETTPCPDQAETNNQWYLDGTDRCHQNKWFVRNRAEAANLDLNRPLKLRNGGIVTLLSSSAAQPNPLVFQMIDGVIFSRPHNGRCFPDRDMDIDVVNEDLNTTELMTISTKMKTMAISQEVDPAKIRLSPEGVLFEVKRVNGKLVDITFIRAGDDA